MTRDGVPIELYGNIGRPEEAAQVMASGLAGVGLFRTEFLVLDAAQPPTLEHQAAIYGQALQALGDKPLVIRTWDLGGDKIPPFLWPQVQGRPIAQVRGLRFTLDYAPELLAVQLQAIVQAAARGSADQVRVLVPMVLGASDLRRARDQLRRLASAAGVAAPPLGAMLETPAALFGLPAILALVDFANVGTNDLTRYLLATERAVIETVPGYSLLHPAVLAALHTILQAMPEDQPPVCLCGEAAGDPALACLLVGLGVRSLSMTPRRAAAVRYALGQVRSQDLAALAQEALAAGGIPEVQTLLRRQIPKAILGQFGRIR